MCHRRSYAGNLWVIECHGRQGKARIQPSHMGYEILQALYVLESTDFHSHYIPLEFSAGATSHISSKASKYKIMLFYSSFSEERNTVGTS